MSKFKVGDQVKIIKTNEICEIQAVDSLTGICEVSFGGLSFHIFDHNLDLITSAAKTPVAFKVGDKVSYVGVHTPYRGLVGTVTEVEFHGDVIVKFPEEPDFFVTCKPESLLFISDGDTQATVPYSTDCNCHIMSHHDDYQYDHLVSCPRYKSFSGEVKQ